jgi:pyruvate dehydrogenase E1 component beta subunit
MGVCLDQISNQAAKMRYMFGGKARIPLVIRTMIGAGLRAAAQHSDSMYSTFVHIPGLKVVAPANPADAKGLLIASIRDDDPVIFCEHKVMYDNQGPVPEGEYVVPLGQANISREGKDATIVAISRMVEFALHAAEALDKEGLSVEVVDPRTLVPLDKEAILKSVAKTGRLVVVDMAHKTCSAASEIAAIVAMEGFWDLQAPIQRLGTINVHIPFSPALEPLCYPTDESIAEAVRVTMS